MLRRQGKQSIGQGCTGSRSKGQQSRAWGIGGGSSFLRAVTEPCSAGRRTCWGGGGWPMRGHVLGSEGVHSVPGAAPSVLPLLRLGLPRRDPSTQVLMERCRPLTRDVRAPGRRYAPRFPRAQPHFRRAMLRSREAAVHREAPSRGEAADSATRPARRARAVSMSRAVRVRSCVSWDLRLLHPFQLSGRSPASTVVVRFSDYELLSSAIFKASF